jgi:DNA-binding transcriptional ArsR family regulator
VFNTGVLCLAFSPLLTEREGKRVNDPWDSSPIYVDTRVAKAMSHPLRVHILGELNKRVMSPSRFSERFEVSLTTTAYHFRVLEKADCVEIVREDGRGRAVEHFYQATKKALFDDEEWERLPETIRNKLSARAVSDFIEVIAEAMREETFDFRTDRHAAWEKAHLDEQGWKEMSTIQREAAEKLMRVAKESRSRLIRSGQLGLMATWAVFFFESPFEELEAPEATGAPSSHGCASTRTRGG